MLSVKITMKSVQNQQDFRYSKSLSNYLNPKLLKLPRQLIFDQYQASVECDRVLENTRFEGKFRLAHLTSSSYRFLLKK